MRNNIIIIAVTIALTWFCVWFFSNDIDIKRQLEDSVKERDSLTVVNTSLKRVNDSLRTEEKTMINNFNTINQNSKIKDDEIQNINNSVYTLNELEVDSTIRQHTHKPYIRE